MHYDLYRKRGFPVGSAVESASKQIVRSRFKRAGASSRKRVPTLCLPSNAASKTIAELTPSIGGFVVSLPPIPKTRYAFLRIGQVYEVIRATRVL